MEVIKYELKGNLHFKNKKLGLLDYLVSTESIVSK